MSANSMQPITEAIQRGNEAKNQFLLNQINNDFAAQQQERQLKADAAAQQRLLQAQKETALEWEQRDLAIQKAKEKAAMMAEKVKQAADANYAKIEKGRVAIEGLVATDQTAAPMSDRAGRTLPSAPTSTDAQVDKLVDKIFGSSPAQQYEASPKSAETDVALRAVIPYHVPAQSNSK